ncbi:MAG: murein hydrolase activator EnvC family protein, partial [Flavobacteriales bacterium]
MKFKIHLNKFVKVLFLVLLVVALAEGLMSQDKSELQRQRDELNQKIELTKKMIRDSEKQQKSTLRQVEMLNAQIALRDDLIRNINGDIHHIEGEINTGIKNIGLLKEDISALKKEYGKMIKRAYRQRSSYDKLMYVFASESFYQAYKRYKITQRFAEARRQQAQMIQGKEQDILSVVQRMELDEQQKSELLKSKEGERKEVESLKQTQQGKLSDLKREEARLKSQQVKQKSDRDRLTSKIQEIIAEEIRRENAKNATAEKKPETEKKPGVAAETAKKIELAPETVLMNADFEKNKGALPWPVSAGVITSHFGKHAHPSLPQITVNNNGVDFGTEKGASALAVFGGKVTSVFNIPGVGQNVIVTHGSYKSVYSGLSDVSVSVGDKVTARQMIGKVSTDGDDYTLHFEIWK